jgi:hypothetical protein
MEETISLHHDADIAAPESSTFPTELIVKEISL